MDKRNLIADDFSTSKTLQQWIGISYDITEEEGRQCLEQSVMEEWKLGSSSFMDISTIVIFKKPVQHLLKLTTTDLKTWFVKVRQGRIRSTTNILKDEFTYDGAMKEWVGL